MEVNKDTDRTEQERKQNRQAYIHGPGVILLAARRRGDDCATNPLASGQPQRVLRFSFILRILHFSVLEMGEEGGIISYGVISCRHLFALYWIGKYFI